MDTREIRCPSGLRGRIRKLSGRDFHQLLIDSAEEATADSMADLASSIWVETLDPGPYKLDIGEKPHFRSDVLIGDRSYALIQARVFTKPENARRPIRIQCEECKAWWPDEFDYAGMANRVWPDDSNTPIQESDPGYKPWVARKRFAAGEPCSTVMDDGVIVEWSLLTGSLLSGPIREFALQFGSSVYSEVPARVVSISGMDMDSFKEPRDRRKAVFDKLNEYPDTDFWELWYDIQDHECGPETDILKQCPACRAKFGYTVDTMGFIWPTVPKRSMRSRAGAQSRRT